MDASIVFKKTIVFLNHGAVKKMIQFSLFI